MCCVDRLRSQPDFRHQMTIMVAMLWAAPLRDELPPKPNSNPPLCPGSSSNFTPSGEPYPAKTFFVLGRNSTARNIRIAAAARSSKRALKPFVPWIQAISGTAEALTENVTM